MGVTYVRRFRMEFDLVNTPIVRPMIPEGYRWLAWDAALRERHAAAKYESFHCEIDSRVFPCLGGLEGCRRLMRDISRQRAFLPDATWLITYQSDFSDQAFDCGTIQGLAQTANVGAVQNVGVVPEHRGLGLGRALVLRALHGFRNAELRRAVLEVTAENTPAVELYRSIGFRLARTMYKAVAAEPVPVS